MSSNGCYEHNSQPTTELLSASVELHCGILCVVHSLLRCLGWRIVSNNGYSMMLMNENEFVVAKALQGLHNEIEKTFEIYENVSTMTRSVQTTRIARPMRYE